MSLLEYKGVPVPWVACWEQEVPSPEDHPMLLVEGVLAYADEAQAGKPSEHDRDKQGALWLRNGIARGKGKPLFGQVHALRQYACMVTPRCQVCGLRMKQHTFLLQEEMVHSRHGQLFTTATPPVCEPCREVALRLCPHLIGVNKAAGLSWVTATDVGIWGYLGDIAFEDGHWDRGQYVSVADKDKLKRLLVKQLVVGVAQYEEVPYGLPTP